MYSSLAFTSCNLRHRIDCRAPARLVLLGLLVLVPTWQLNAAGLEQAGAQSSQSIMESIAQNWNTSEDLQIEELTRVLDVAHGLLTAQPGLPRHVAELRAGGASAFLVFLMMNHTTISREDVQSWATTVSTFLRQHAGQMWESGHSSLAAGGETTHRKRMAMAAGADGGSDSSHGVFGLTARDQAGLTGLPLVRRVLIAKLLLSWMGPWGRQLPEGAEHLIQDIVKQVRLHPRCKVLFDGRTPSVRGHCWVHGRALAGHEMLFSGWRGFQVTRQQLCSLLPSCAAHTHAITISCMFCIGS